VPWPVVAEMYFQLAPSVSVRTTPVAPVGGNARQRPAFDLDQEDAAVGQGDGSLGKLQSGRQLLHLRSLPAWRARWGGSPRASGASGEGARSEAQPSEVNSDADRQQPGSRATEESPRQPALDRACSRCGEGGRR
jgi:hypothetical protein